MTSRRPIIAGVVIAAAFIFAVSIDGMSYPSAIASLVVAAAIGYTIKSYGTSILEAFGTAFFIVLIAWLWSTGGNF